MFVILLFGIDLLCALDGYWVCLLVWFILFGVYCYFDCVVCCGCLYLCVGCLFTSFVFCFGFSVVGCLIGNRLTVVCFGGRLALAILFYLCF